jgi:sugar lactone lactonase YvrE
MEKPGALYHIHPDCRVEIVDDNILLSNGLAFSVDSRTLYYADSAARVIYAYHVDPGTGHLSQRRSFVRVPIDDGIPDGLTVDSEDHVWCALWYGGQVIRYDPDGRIERRIALPSRQTSSVTFGGADLTDLFVTSASEPWPSELAPTSFRADDPNMGGSLYRIRLPIQGKPPHLAKIH